MSWGDFGLKRELSYVFNELLGEFVRDAVACRRDLSTVFRKLSRKRPWKSSSERFTRYQNRSPEQNQDVYVCSHFRPRVLCATIVLLMHNPKLVVCRSIRGFRAFAPLRFRACM